MRKTIKKDLTLFAIPALVVFVLGLIASGRDGYDGLVGTLWEIVLSPERRNQLSTWNIAGLSLFIAGLSIAILAAYTLQRFYSSTLVTRENHQLITHGPYRLVRHPIYFGVLIAILGVPVYAPSLFGFLILLLLIPIFLFRIKMEEEMLTEFFGDEYRAYRTTTKKLIPFLF